jgi:hypothetical protein
MRAKDAGRLGPWLGCKTQCCSVAGLQIAVDARAKKTLCYSVTGLWIVVADEICERKMLGDSVPAWVARRNVARSLVCGS